MANKTHVNIEIDKFTNSIENVLTVESFKTEFDKITIKEIKKTDWLFNWHKDLKDNSKEGYQMTTGCFGFFDVFFEMNFIQAK